MAVVVVVGRGRAHGVADAADAGGIGDVGESHVAIVAVEAVREACRRSCRATASGRRW